MNVSDILAVIAYWGTSNAIHDLNNNGLVDVGDLLTVIDAWGNC